MLDPTYQEEGRRGPGREQGYKGKGEREREESEWRKLTTAGGRLNRGGGSGAGLNSKGRKEEVARARRGERGT